MSRLSIELTPAQHRQIKAMAAFNGLSLKEFILKSVFTAKPKRGKPKGMDETEYLLSSPANARQLREALHGDPSKRLRFDSVEDLKNALGV